MVLENDEMAGSAGLRRSTRRKVQKPIIETSDFDEDFVDDLNNREKEYKEDVIIVPTVKKARKTVKEPKKKTTKEPKKSSKDTKKAVEPIKKKENISKPKIIPLKQGDAKEVSLPEGFEYLEISIEDPHATNQYYHEFDDNSEKESDANSSARIRINRSLRLGVRHLHLKCLVATFHRLNAALCVPFLKAIAISIVPPHLHRQFTREIIVDGRTVHNSLSMMCHWWKNSRKRLDTVLEVAGSIKWIPGQSHFPRLLKVLFDKIGTTQDQVAIFVAILRGLGLKARLVASLQPILVKPPNIDDDGNNLKEEFMKIPPFWAEVFLDGKWIPVDCLRAIVNDRLAMEPPSPSLSKLGRQHLFILAFDEGEKVFDVTRRYCSRYYGWTARLRRCDEDSLHCLLRDPISLEEEAELSSMVDGEAIPKTVAGFHCHGRYILDSQLKKYEVFWPPDAGIIGEFKGENVRLKVAAKKVRSKEAWYTQFGRIIKEGEEACKFVKLPKKPERKRKGKNSILEQEKEEMEAEGERPLQPLYGEWQTEPFSPPIAMDGRVPCNKFGNVDLYLPSMLPVGCVWINHPWASEAARTLDIHFADACTRFVFSGRFARPDLRGIVVTVENEGPILEYIKEAEEEELKRLTLENNKNGTKDDRKEDLEESANSENDYPAPFSAFNKKKTSEDDDGRISDFE